MIKANQIYRAKAKKGFRYIEVQQVRNKGNSPYIIAREVLPSGKLAYGIGKSGIPRDLSFTVVLSFRDGEIIMPSTYELVEKTIDNPKENTE